MCSVSQKMPLTREDFANASKGRRITIPPDRHTPATRISPPGSSWLNARRLDCLFPRSLRTKGTTTSTSLSRFARNGKSGPRYRKCSQSSGPQSKSIPFKASMSRAHRDRSVLFGEEIVFNLGEEQTRHLENFRTNATSRPVWRFSCR